MHDSFESLQQRCKNYYKKRLYAKLRLAFLAIAVIGVFVWLFMFSALFDENSTAIETPIMQPQTSQELKQEPKTERIVQNVVEVKKPEPQKIEPPVVTTQAEVVPEREKPLRKDVAYSVNVDESYLLDYARSEKREVKKPVKKSVVKPPVKSKPVSKKHDSKPLKMSTKKIDSVATMIDQYEKESTYDLALKISQRYYDDKKYAKASLWAKKANMLDKASDRAWVMYAKSEYARGNVSRAKDILQLYLANKSSQEAELLLMTWREGE